MANIEQIAFQPSSNQKVIVEELIESELEGIVGGESSEVSQVSVMKTDGSESNIQKSSQKIVKNGDKKPYRLQLNDLLKSLGVDLDIKIKVR